MQITSSVACILWQHVGREAADAGESHFLLLLNTNEIFCSSKVYINLQSKSLSNQSKFSLSRQITSGVACRWQHVGREAADAGESPSSRSKHAVCQYGDVVYLHGGKAGNVACRDLWSWNIGGCFCETLSINGVTYSSPNARLFL